MSVKLLIKVVPGSSRNSIVGWHGESVKIKLIAPPEKGKANKALLKLLALKLNLPLSSFVLIRGHSNPNKLIEIQGLTLDEIKHLLKL